MSQPHDPLYSHPPPGGERRTGKVLMSRAVATTDGPCCASGSRGIGTEGYIQHPGPRGPSTHSQRLSQTAPRAPPQILPLTKHSLDGVVHLGVLVVLG